jgi:microcompartment protein CcmK/EutM
VADVTTAGLEVVAAMDGVGGGIEEVVLICTAGHCGVQ